jgi:non-heme chloroperoxidase
VLVRHGDADASAPSNLTGRPTAKLPCAWVEGATRGLYVTVNHALNDDLVTLARGERKT